MILEEIINYKRIEVAKSKIVEPYDANIPPSSNKGAFKRAIAKQNISLIAEVKKASPSKGVFVKDFDPVKIATSYEKGGARAVSVLTDNRFFQGSIDDLKKVKEAISLPILRKDFIIDPYQLYQSRAIGADAVLLIAAVLDEKELKELITLANELGLDTLVEIHTAKELEKALLCGAEIIGINNRDLNTFNTDISNTMQIIRDIPDNCLVVSESGISTARDVEKLVDVGVDAILVGEALVTSDNIERRIIELLGGSEHGMA